MKRTSMILLTLTVIIGCATSEIVYLRNNVGDLVQCGPYTNYGNIPNSVASSRIQLRDCISDYQRQGYERVPSIGDE